jgi:hypothetical protein
MFAPKGLYRVMSVPETWSMPYAEDGGCGRSAAARRHDPPRRSLVGRVLERPRVARAAGTSARIAWGEFDPITVPIPLCVLPLDRIRRMIRPELPMQGRNDTSPCHAGAFSALHFDRRAGQHWTVIFVSASHLFMSRGYSDCNIQVPVPAAWPPYVRIRVLALARLVHTSLL